MTVSIKKLDHVNLRTADLPRMIAWYRDVLGLREGPRPDFSFNGAWLYIGDDPVIHLVDVSTPPVAGQNLALEHFALAATGMAGLLEQLRSRGEPAKVRRVPDFPIVQVNLWDPDGNHLHVDFDLKEAEGMDLD
jgi:catechol 2,3-dioxygenase-like lactoylglutathione lyase family enzyme